MLVLLRSLLVALRRDEGYMDGSSGAAGGALAATGLSLSLGWWLMAAITMIFLGVALLQLTRRPPKERP